MSNKIIRATLEGRLKAWADAQSPPIPVAFEGVSFTKPATGVFLQPTLIPNTTLNLELTGKRATMLGIFEVGCWGASGTGMGDVETLANSIINLFPILPTAGHVSIQGTPYSERPMIDESGWLIIPVLALYRYETLNK